ncbi:MAG: sn-glycerol-3-phosphate ABC transporter ATP-binding protein UgpC [Acidobacteria bacterium]|nr:sn-glycerol-3-phosphate ABC transporter ATP-binding protein UgpC [Acidobacteriota bacterium]MCB9397651.1 sn-glycerol-3-phosphate ABC transporter ATP-binding protein UgpC [Acidobacteriota bacterium]
MAGIRLENICKRYGEVSVIEGLNLEIQDKEFMVLVGPSGCGKSTALRMIAGLEEISEGNLFIGDNRVNDWAPKDRDVAMVFQSYALYPHMTVRENIGFGLKMRKMPKPEINQKVDDAAKMLGLSQLLDRKPKALSGGQRQRVALGRAIVRNPKVFLFDEPLSNLDAELRVQMRSEISQLQKKLQTTAVYVTHDQVEAMTMGHRITVLNKGQLMQVGTPLQLFNSPDNIFVARFIGSPPMNVLTASVSASGDQVEGPGFKIPIPPCYSHAAQSFRNRDIKWGIRPGRVSWTQKADYQVAVETEVFLVEPLGNEVIVHAQLQGQPLVAKLPPSCLGQLGDQLTLYVDTRHLYLFDPASEQALSLDQERHLEQED